MHKGGSKGGKVAEEEGADEHVFTIRLMGVIWKIWPGWGQALKRV